MALVLLHDIVYGTVTEKDSAATAQVAAVSFSATVSN